MNAVYSSPCVMYARWLLTRDIYLFLILIPELMQLLDDDTVSFCGLAALVNPPRKSKDAALAFIHRLTMSLYLMTQCQIKLRHPVKSLATTLDYVRLAPSSIGQTLKCILDDSVLDGICWVSVSVKNAE